MKNINKNSFLFEDKNEKELVFKDLGKYLKMKKYVKSVLF